MWNFRKSQLFFITSSVNKKLVHETLKIYNYKDISLFYVN